MIYTFGYARANAMKQLTFYVEHLPLRIIDIRLEAYSRFMPEFRQGSLKQRFGDRYLHVSYLGNRNCHDYRLPIEIVNLEEGLRVVSEFLFRGEAVCLLCVHSYVERCHRLTVASKLASTCPYWSVQHW
jgi:hypothetical protein